MKYRYILKEILPPVLFRALFNRKVSEQSESSKPKQVTPTFPTYEKALVACQGYGYEEDALVRVVLAKTKIFQKQLLTDPSMAWTGQTTQLLFGLSLALAQHRQTKPGHPLQVIDVGGACGAHYFTVRSFFAREVTFCWYVVETLAMAQAAHELENDELHFCSDLNIALEACHPIDMIHSSGTIQCVQQPRELLGDLVNFGARFLLLSRLGVTRGQQDVICIHQSRLSDNGPGPLPEGFQDGISRYPFSFIQLSDLDAIIGRSYRTIFRFDDNTGVFPVNDEPLVGLGYLCERIDEPRRT
ncbi:MAG: methyltransferase, TIGR04325 family [Chloroflexota bacterium]